MFVRPKLSSIACLSLPEDCKILSKRSTLAPLSKEEQGCFTIRIIHIRVMVRRFIAIQFIYIFNSILKNFFEKFKGIPLMLSNKTVTHLIHHSVYSLMKSSYFFHVYIFYQSLQLKTKRRSSM